MKATLFLALSALCAGQNALTPASNAPPAPNGAPAPKPAPAPQAAAAPAPIKIGGVTLSINLRSRVEVFDWFQPSSGDNTYGYSGNLLRLGLAKKYEKWDWNAEFAVPFLLGLPANPIAPGTQGALGVGANYFTANNKSQNAAMIFPKQLYANITQFGDSKANSLKIGRFEFLDGSETAPKNASLAVVKRDRVNQRLLGNFGWSDVGRSFDGLQYSYSKPGATFTFVGGVPTRGVFQVDGWGWNKTAFGYTSVAVPWVKGVHSAETRVLAIYYDDFRRVVKTDNRAAGLRANEFANIKIWTAGGNSIHAFNTQAGTLDAMVWGVLQGGKWGIQDHSAYAFDVEGGYQPKVLPKLKPWLRGGYSTTSGDSNATDNKHETYFQLMPTPRPYAKFPFFNMMNNKDRFGMLVLRPHAKITTSSEFHSLALASGSDLWYAGGGVFQPWTFGYTGRATGGRRSLANLYDTSVEYRVHPHVTFTAYYGYAQGKAVMQFIYPQGKNGQFGYLEAMFRF